MTHRSPLSVLPAADATVPARTPSSDPRHTPHRRLKVMLLPASAILMLVSTHPFCRATAVLLQFPLLPSPVLPFVLPSSSPCTCLSLFQWQQHRSPLRRWHAFQHFGRRSHYHSLVTQKKRRREEREQEEERMEGSRRDRSTDHS